MHAAVNRSMSTKKQFRNDLNFEVSSGFSNSCSFLFRICFLFWYWIAKSHKAFGALSRLGLISKFLLTRVKFVPGVSNFMKLVCPTFLSCHQNSSQKPNLL